MRDHFSLYEVWLSSISICWCMVVTSSFSHLLVALPLLPPGLTPFHVFSLTDSLNVRDPYIVDNLKCIYQQNFKGFGLAYRFV